MSDQSCQDITGILSELRMGKSNAAERLFPVVQNELRGIAGKLFKSAQLRGNLIQPTILVHDVFMKLAQKTDIDWESRVHFFAVAAKVTRDFLGRSRAKRRRRKTWR